MRDDIKKSTRMLLQTARELSWERFGKTITFYLPGMFTLDGVTGKYSALSITGSACMLQCDHCRGKILAGMIPAEDPEKLIAHCRRLARRGDHGVLISGGCDQAGRLPWGRFLTAIAQIKAETDLFVSIHSGLVNDAEARALKRAGVDQALIDVIGDDDTFRRINHVPFGVSRIEAALASLQKAGISTVPHVVCGIDHGRINSEIKALDMISRFDVAMLVIVSLMNIPGTPTADAIPPPAESVSEIIAAARIQLPSTRLSLGCARRRGDSHLAVLAVDAGVNRMALPPPEAIARANDYGLTIRYQKTCCSMSADLSTPSFN